MAHQLPAHGLVALPLLEGVAGAVPVLVESQGRVGEFLLDEILNDGLLVFNGSVVPVQLLVHGDAAVAGDVKAFDHGCSFLSAMLRFIVDNIVSQAYQESNQNLWGR